VVLDKYVPVSLLNAFLPFGEKYKPLWLGLGAVSVDLFVAVAVTSLLRVRFGPRSWRAIHWLVYPCWGLAVIHGLGIGSDRHQAWFLAINLVAVASVAGAVVRRLSVWDGTVAALPPRSRGALR
jgi:DMSO/TMAO reductase YedYZ heme-binding membrane subunit